MPGALVETIYYPVGGAVVDFIAYYPFQQGVQSLRAFLVSISDQNDRKRIDLLVANNASGISRDIPDVALNFRYQWCNLEFNISPGDAGSVENLRGADVIIKSIPVTATYNLLTGELIPNVQKDITALMNVTGTNGKAIVLLRNAGSEVSFEIRLKSGSFYTAFLSADSRWEPGTSIPII